MIRSFRGNLPITIDMSYNTPFHIPPLKPHATRYKEMHQWDREKWRHSPELYAVWNAKPYLLDYAVRNARANGNIYDFAFWTDAGAIRDDNKFSAWPDGRRVKEVFEMAHKESGTLKERLIFFPLWLMPDAKFKYWTEDMGPVDAEFSEGTSLDSHFISISCSWTHPGDMCYFLHWSSTGSFFGGMPASITWFRRVFYTYHNHYLSEDKFVGKDQTLFNSIFLLFPARFFGVSLWDSSSPAHAGIPWNADTALGTCGNTWYYYEWWLANKETRDEMAEIWLTDAHRKSRGWNGFWKTSVRCREGDALGMQGILKRQFGSGWVAPKRDVKMQYV